MRVVDMSSQIYIGRTPARSMHRNAVLFHGVDESSRRLTLLKMDDSLKKQFESPRDARNAETSSMGSWRSND